MTTNPPSPRKMDYHKKEKVSYQQTRHTKVSLNPRASSKERQFALQKEVEKLKRKLKYEENVHKALERAFNRPLGSLPRLPSYLPRSTLELLAEVAVLEEEVARLEYQFEQFSQCLHLEPISVHFSKKHMSKSAQVLSPAPRIASKQRHLRQRLTSLHVEDETKQHFEIE